MRKWKASGTDTALNRLLQDSGTPFSSASHPRAIAFQISITYNDCHPERSEGSAVVFHCFSVRTGKAMIQTCIVLREISRKATADPSSHAPQDDKSKRVLKEFQMQLPCIPEALVEGLGQMPQRVLKAFDYIAQFASEEEIRALKPDFAKLCEIDLRGICVTAPGEKCDFVSIAGK
jgi:hypothetical protein